MKKSVKMERMGVTGAVVSILCCFVALAASRLGNSNLFWLNRALCLRPQKGEMLAIFSWARFGIGEVGGFSSCQNVVRSPYAKVCHIVKVVEFAKGMTVGENFGKVIRRENPIILCAKIACMSQPNLYIDRIAQ